jgi:hypothetical protein
MPRWMPVVLGITFATSCAQAEPQDSCGETATIDDEHEILSVAVAYVARDSVDEAATVLRNSMLRDEIEEWFTYDPRDTYIPPQFPAEDMLVRSESSIELRGPALESVGTIVTIVTPDDLPPPPTPENPDPTDEWDQYEATYGTRLVVALSRPGINCGHALAYADYDHRGTIMLLSRGVNLRWAVTDDHLVWIE